MKIYKTDIKMQEFSFFKPKHQKHLCSQLVYKVFLFLYNVSDVFSINIQNIKYQRMDIFIHNEGKQMPHQEMGHEKHDILKPDWEKAKLHGQAVSVGFFDHSKGGQQYCECCFQQIHKNPIPLTQNTKELQFLGFGIPLYFAFIRNCIFLLIVLICSYNIISLYSSYQENKAYCDELQLQNKIHKHTHTLSQAHYARRHFEQKSRDLQGEKKQLEQQNTQALQCETWMLFYSRLQKKVDYNQMIIRFSSFMIHMLLLIYMRDKLIKLKEYFDERITSPSDYTLLMVKIPEEKINLRNTILDLLQKEFETKKKDVVEIILVPELKQFQQLEEKLHGHTKLLKQHRTDNKKEEAEKIEHEIELIQQQIRKYVIGKKENYVQGKINAQKAFIIFNTQTDKDETLQKFQQKGFSDPQWKLTRIDQAPQPKEIIWQNFYISEGKQKFRIFLGWLLSILVLVGITVMFFFISKQKSYIVEQLLQKYKHDKVNNVVYEKQALVLVFVMIFFVVLFNKMFIATLFHTFTDLQRHSSSYKFQISFCLKYCLGLFFTTALMTLLVEAFFFKNYAKEYGVIQEQTIMYMVNSLFVPFFWLVNPVYQIRKCKQNRSNENSLYTQAQANDIMQMPGYDVGKRYGQILEVMWFTALYMTLIPIGGLFSAGGLFLYYWIDKYNLLRRSTIKSQISGQLIHLTLNMLDFTLVLRSIGDIIFDYQIRDQIPITSWICLGLALVYQLLPTDKIIDYFNEQKFYSAEKTYDQAQSSFSSTYYDEHALFSYLSEDREHRIKNFKKFVSLKDTHL